MPAKRQRWSWYLYDFSDSILTFNGVLYFPKWIVVDSGAGDVAYNLALAITMVLLVVTTPVVGFLSDARVGRLAFLRLARYGLAGSTGLVILAGVAFPPGAARTALALVGFAIFMYANQASSAFYNALLPRVAGSVDAYARVAANGFAWGRVGALAGILACLPFASSRIALQEYGPPAPLLPAALAYFVLTGIALRLMPDDRSEGDDGLSARRILGSLRRDLEAVRHDRRLLFFVAGLLIAMDAILTIQANLTLYMEQIVRFTAAHATYLLIMLIVTSAVGAKASALAANRFGLNASFVAVLACGALAVAGLSLFVDRAVFVALLAVVGLAYGAISNCARSTYLMLIPDHRRAVYLSVYASLEKCVAVTGPLAWGAIVGQMGVDTGYRVALFAMGVLVVISIPLVRAGDPGLAGQVSRPLTA
jgi:UMF1 family MFS transporter